MRFSRPRARVVRAGLAGSDRRGQSDTLQVAPTFLVIEGLASPRQGARERYTVTARDAQGQPVADFEGTLVVTTGGEAPSGTASSQPGSQGAAPQGQEQGLAGGQGPEQPSSRSTGDANAIVAVAGAQQGQS